MNLVTLIMLDGVRPDALDIADAPNLRAFRSRASWTMTAQSVMPSITLPCHTSIFHSVPPSRHGVTTNVWMPMARPLPGIVDVAHAAGLRVAFFHNWEPLRDLNRPESLHFSYYRNSSHQSDGDDDIADEVARYLGRATSQRPGDMPHFMFVYFGNVDTAGHAFGWMSDGYLAQLACADRAFGVVMGALPADSNVIVHSDHGGHERTHGTDSPDDMNIPWMAAGPRIRRNHSIARAMSLLDTAPTIARLLDLKPHQMWEGSCPDEIFE